jgi:ssDNA-binding Zn-finger/Zn-ribbon topoisomerase 1
MIEIVIALIIPLWIITMIYVIYKFCIKSVRPNIECPVCHDGMLQVNIKTRKLKCDKCGAIFR